MRIGFLALSSLFGTTALAAPPPPAPPAVPEPAIEMRLHEGNLTYTYDLTPVFDDAMWAVLVENGFSEILIQVSLVDAGEKLAVTQHHQLKVELQPDGQIRLTSGPRQEALYPNRAAMLKALRAVRGKPIPATDFATSEGYLDMLVLVNPVQVFDYPEDGASGVAVGERVLYDRKLEARSAPMTPGRVE